MRTLVRETKDAGLYRVAWDGRDDAGARIGAGVYYAYLTSPEGRFSRAIVHLR